MVVLHVSGRGWRIHCPLSAGDKGSCGQRKLMNTQPALRYSLHSPVKQQHGEEALQTEIELQERKARFLRRCLVFVMQLYLEQEI